MGVWNDAIAYRVAHVAENIYPDGNSVDVDRETVEAAGIEMAEAIALALWAYELVVPVDDDHLTAVLNRDAEPAPLVDTPRGAVVRTRAGRLGLTIGRGFTVESAGESLAIITAPEPDRYVQAWFIPGVDYLDREGR